jgi:hypothetical protein
MAHDGEAILVTYRGKPYFVTLPPEKARTFLGAARSGKPLTSKLLDPVFAAEEWHSAR